MNEEKQTDERYIRMGELQSDTKEKQKDTNEKRWVIRVPLGEA